MPEQSEGWVRYGCAPKVQSKSVWRGLEGLVHDGLEIGEWKGGEKKGKCGETLVGWLIDGVISCEYRVRVCV